MHVDVTLQGEKRSITIPALVDSGTSHVFMSRQFAEQMNMRLLPFPEPIPLYNVDGSMNKEGSVTHYAVLRMTIEGHTNLQHIPVTNTGDERLIIGFEWLTKYNPDIDWKK